MCVQSYRGARARTLLAVLVSALLFAPLSNLLHAQLTPSITSVRFDENGDVELSANFPPGFRHAVLEVVPDGMVPFIWQPIASGPLTGAAGDLRFVIPKPGTRVMFRVVFDTSTVVPPTTYMGLDHVSPAYDDGGFYLAESSKPVHILNRIAYGPGPLDYNKLITMGSTAYINEQLAPATIDESGNTALNTRVDDLFHVFLPYGGTPLLPHGSPCRFFRGKEEPSPGVGGVPTTDWAQTTFDDTNPPTVAQWEDGTTSVGYGDGDDATVLDDMRQDNAAIPPVPGYYSVYTRQTFNVADPTQVDTLLLRITYDDGFVAYLNGTRVADQNVSGNPPAYNQNASTGGNVDGSDPYEFDITAHKGLLVSGQNLLAVQMHNASLTSSDSSIDPSLVSVSPSPYPAIKGVKELQHLIHLRGIYSEKQLQAVLGEFWENHFTTDYDKVSDYFEDHPAFQDLVNSGVPESQVDLQARTEAVSLEYDEYQFFYDNALGDFGDLLLYSATSPTMLIYLDNILNVAGAPNENYAREICELHTFGVDNVYTQFDIEELSRCFSGWTVKKVRPADKLPFPLSARTPPITPSIVVDTETAVVDTGATWHYFKGTAEPTPGLGGEATTDWTDPLFVPGAGWLAGPTGIGYGDGDDATVLGDMQRVPDPVDPINNPPVVPGYSSVYLRHQFTVDPSLYDAMVLEVDYDDGFVAYLNGTPIASRGTNPNAADIRENGIPPTYDYTSSSHEAGNPIRIDLTPWAGLLAAAPANNTLAIQVHNQSFTSSDLTMIPRVLGVNYTPESISESDPNGVWTFRFDPDEHDIGQKILFDATPYEMIIPAGRLGVDGVLDALDVIDALVDALPTKQFICVKLVNRFVSDEISLDTYLARTAPDWLLTLVDNAIAGVGIDQPAGEHRDP